MTDGFNQHATGTTSRIVNSISSLWIKNFNQQLNYCTGSVELTAGLLCNFSKLLDKVFIRVTHDIGRIVAVAHMDGRQVFNQIFQHFIGELVLIGPVCIIKAAEHTLQLLAICGFNSGHSIDDCDTDILGHIANILPMAAIGNYKRMYIFFLKEECSSFAVLLFYILSLFVIYIRDALEEEKRNDISLVFFSTNRATDFAACTVDSGEKLLACSLSICLGCYFIICISGIHCRTYHL